MIPKLICFLTHTFSLLPSSEPERLNPQRNVSFKSHATIFQVGISNQRESRNLTTQSWENISGVNTSIRTGRRGITLLNKVSLAGERERREGGVKERGRESFGEPGKGFEEEEVGV